MGAGLVDQINSLTSERAQFCNHFAFTRPSSYVCFVYILKTKDKRKLSSSLSFPLVTLKQLILYYIILYYIILYYIILYYIILYYIILYYIILYYIILYYKQGMDRGSRSPVVSLSLFIARQAFE